MKPLYDLHEEPALDEPVLIVLLEGWIDAGYAAGGAAHTLLEGLDTFPLATFDADELLDHRARRPIMHLVDGVNTGLSWPGIELRAGTDLDGNDLMLLIGAEPDHRWKAFSQSLVRLLENFGTRMVLGLGAYPAAVPHTRPIIMSVTAASNPVADLSGLQRGSLDVPAGVQAVIEYECGDADIPAMGIWAQVPHYLAGDVHPYPAASLALIQNLERIGGLHLPHADLDGDARRAANRIDAAMAADGDHLGLLHQLESRYDQVAAESSGLGLGDLPSGDELAAELERFLRDQGREP